MKTLTNLVDDYKQILIAKTDLIKEMTTRKDTNDIARFESKLDEYVINASKIRTMVHKEMAKRFFEPIIINNVLVYVHSEELLIIRLDEIQNGENT